MQTFPQKLTGLIAFVLGVVLLSATAVCLGEEAQPLNLLRIEDVKITAEQVAADSSANLQRLVDGDAATTAVLPATGDFDVEVSFSDTIVAPAELVVSLSKESGDAAPARIELLGSMLPGQAGLKSLKSAVLKAEPAIQRFKLPSSGARFLLIRITPPRGAGRVSVGDIAVMGRLGAPPTNYAFKESPAAALKVIARLKQSTSLAADEAALLADADDGRLDNFTLAEAGLIASGVLKAEQRKPFLEQLDTLTSKAKQATAGARKFALGETLLRWLHRHAFDGGYHLPDSEINKVLSTGKFNCVSSSLIYAIVGRRLGLDVRGVEVPDHVLSIVYDGAAHVDVETTSPHGFDPGNRQAAREQFEKQTGFDYVAERYKDQRREIASRGLVAVVYYNRGVAAAEAGQFEESLGYYFRALRIDREFASAVKNALSTFQNWSLKLWKEKKYERAAEVANAGLELAPDHEGLKTNRAAFYTAWAMAEMEAGRDAAAVHVLRQAQEVDPQGKYLAMQAWIYIRPSEDAAQEGQWAKALLLAESGLKNVDAAAREDLRKWRENLYVRWSAEALEKKNYQLAVKVNGLAVDKLAESARFEQRMAYAAQEWARDVADQSGFDAGVKVLQPVLKEHGEIEKIRTVADSYVRREVVENLDAGQYSNAVAAAKRGAGLVKDQTEAAKLRNYAVDQWAKSFLDKSEFQNAASVYEDAANQFPQDKHLQQASVAIWVRWARHHAEKKEWPKALAVYQKALKAHPAEADFRNNVAFYGLSWAREVRDKQGLMAGANILSSLRKVYPQNPDLKDVATIYAEEQVRQHYNAEEYGKALDAALVAADLHPDQDSMANFTRLIADKHAAALTKQGKFAEATAAYDKVLAEYPADKHVTHNLMVTWQIWGKTFIEGEKWAAGVDFFTRAAKRFPGEDYFAKALKYCRAKAGR